MTRVAMFDAFTVWALAFLCITIEVCAAEVARVMVLQLRNTNERTFARALGI